MPLERLRSAARPANDPPQLKPEGKRDAALRARKHVSLTPESAGMWDDVVTCSMQLLECCNVAGLNMSAWTYPDR